MLHLGQGFRIIHGEPAVGWRWKEEEGVTGSLLSGSLSNTGRGFMSQTMVYGFFSVKTPGKTVKSLIILGF